MSVIIHYELVTNYDNDETRDIRRMKLCFVIFEVMHFSIVLNIDSAVIHVTCRHCMNPTQLLGTNLIPRPPPDFISQLWRKNQQLQDNKQIPQTITSGGVLIVVNKTSMLFIQVAFILKTLLKLLD